MNVECLGDLPNRFPLADEPLHEFCLFGVELSRTPQMNSPPSSGLPAGTGAFPEQIAFKLSDGRKHGHHQLTGMSCYHD